MLGADPEFFVVDGEGVPQGAHNWFLDKKVAAREREKLINSGSPVPPEEVIRDGFAVEINPAPSSCRHIFGTNVWGALGRVIKALPVGHRLLAKSAVSVDLEKIKNEGPADLLRAGCDPSLNARSRKVVPPPNYADSPLRFAGGHLHFSVDPNGLTMAYFTPNVFPHIVRLMDIFLGLPFQFLFGDREEVKERNKTYGRPGEYRVQQYPGGYVGLEYRSLGPEVFLHPVLISMFTGLGRWVINSAPILVNDSKVASLQSDTTSWNLGCPCGSCPAPITNFVVKNYTSPEILKAMKPWVDSLGSEIQLDKWKKWYGSDASEPGFREFVQWELGMTVPGTSNIYW